MTALKQLVWHGVVYPLSFQKDQMTLSSSQKTRSRLVTVWVHALKMASLNINSSGDK